jgi:hypothetical protein
MNSTVGQWIQQVKAQRILRKVAQAVVHALTAKRPKTRYLVGQDARIRAMLEFLPNRIVDEITAKAMNLQ